MKHGAAIFLTVLGSLHMVGQLADVTALKGLAAATNASPAPKVFSSVAGLETYSTTFSIEWKDPDGRTQSLAIDGEVYSRLDGPYNRRNVYGAVLAFGPVLASRPITVTMFESVLRYAACGERRLLAELGVDPIRVRDPIIVRITPLPGVDLGDLPTVLEAPCR